MAALNIMETETSKTNKPLQQTSPFFWRMIWLLPLIMLLHIQVISAQENAADSLYFEMQRQKVNKLLENRETRFGQFNESIRKKTGIFGLKTKKDMQASIDILQSIVLTDEEIFQETKQLLNYKDQILDYQEFEKNQIQKLASDYDNRINAYISTISKLQKEQANLKGQIDTAHGKTQLYLGLTFILAILSAILGLFWWQNRQKLTKK